ncbi:MAG: sodium-translocating pyrophosphatase [Bacteroidota bacterium]
MDMLIYVVPVIAILALIYSSIITARITKEDQGTDRMKQIAGYIATGAMSFLKAEYKILAVFVVIVSVMLGISADAETSSPLIVLAFVTGAFLSAFAGFIGMRVATKANVRTTNAARTSLSKALSISFSGGAVMGISVAALGILGLSLLFMLFQHMFNANAQLGAPLKRVLEVLTGFSLGAESIALFARVGGGIFTKAADVGADLVGKVEAGIPEDDPRNPAVIADNVGDNVGDVAGMGADLFGSYVSTVLATMVLGASVVMSKENPDQFGGMSAVILPLIIAIVGLVFSIVGSWFVRIKENGNPQKALNMGNWGAIIFTAAACYFVITKILPSTFSIKGIQYTNLDVFYTVVIGLVVGALMSVITEFYCAMGKNPVMTIARQSMSGAATNIISGLSVGMISTALPILVLAGGIIASFSVAGIYGVAIAASGMMATTGIQLAIDAFGPIADNAGGIAEMSHLPKEVREKTDILDSVGNTTAAIGKGFAIASAALTSLALFAAFKEITGLDVIDISNAKVLAGLFIGGMIPFLFSALAMRAVGRAANAMVVEVRRQFREIKGLLEGKEGVEPDYDKCIQISTSAALRLMLLPGILAISTPIIIGFGFGQDGPQVLAAVMAGVAVAGVLMAIFQSNAGGAWDNAKKSFEKGVEIDGKMYYKGSEPHKAAVTGDTVGDPFKDTSGPSMNILIKLTAIVSLVIAPLLNKGGNTNKTEDASIVTSEAAMPNADIKTLSGQYPVDAGHSFVSYSINHWMGKAHGAMPVDTGMIMMTGDPKTSSVFMQFDAANISTGSDMRNETMRDTGWFFTAANPKIILKTNGIDEKFSNGNHYSLNGEITIKGITKSIAVPFNYLGEKVTSWGTKVYSFEGEAVINRNDFNIGKPNLEFLGDEARIEFTVESSIKIQ